MKTQTEINHHEQTLEMLHELNLPRHRLGYQYLVVAIPYFAKDRTQSLRKDLYLYLESQFQHSDWKSIDCSIRDVIADAWDSREPQVWKQYFPSFTKAPSNKQFIAALAERLK